MKKNGRGGVTKSEKTVEVLYGWSYITYTYLCTCFPSQFYLYFSTRIDSFFYHECTCTLPRGATVDFWQARPTQLRPHQGDAATAATFYFSKSRQDSGLASLTSCGGPNCITSHGRKGKLQRNAVIKSGLSCNLLQDFPIHREKL